MFLQKEKEVVPVYHVHYVINLENILVTKTYVLIVLLK